MSIHHRQRLQRGMAAVAALWCVAAAAWAEDPHVSTDVVPVHSLVARVMQGLGEPQLVVEPGASPHGLSLSPSHARALQDADAIFWVGPALEPWLAGAIETLAPDAVVTALIDAPGTSVLAFRTGATFAPHAHEHDEPTQEHGAQDGPEHGPHDGHAGEDPHAWLDPENGKIWLGVIADALARLDPANAATYAANAEAGRTEIDAVQDEIRALLEPVRDLRFIVFHDAYHYFENRFGVSAAGAISLGDASSPSPARVEEVRDTVLELGVECVFSEPQYNQALVRTVTEGTGARSATVDPLGAQLEPGPRFYVQLLRSVAERFAECAR